jgi:hypothetical protein
VDAIVRRLETQKTSVLAAGVGGGVAGGAICLIKTRSVAGAIICPALFLGIGYVSYEFAADIERQISKALESAAIYRIYQGFVDKNNTTKIEIEALDFVGKEPVLASQVEAAWVDAMDSGEFCDAKGRPNKTLLEASQLINSKFN